MKFPLTISETQDNLLNKSVSAVELVDKYLSEINAKDKKINAFLTLTVDEAYAKAKLIDKSLATFTKADLASKRLFGVVVAHKDLYLTKGIRTTAGSKVLEHFVPPYSSTVVERMDREGAIMIGKTNLDAWAHGASGENSDFGATLNPWNLNKVAGGSSSGSAASIAANFALVSTGTDTGGSIRCPANFCGVVGLKPTYGVVSRYGVIAMASSTDSMGSMARTVSDVETVFNVVKGEDGFDSTLVNFDYAKSKLKPINEMTIGIPKEYFEGGLNEEVRKCTEKAIEVFKSMGVKLVDVSLPHTKHAISVYYIVQPAEVSSNLGRYDGVRFGHERHLFGDEAKRRIMIGTHVLSSGYYDAYYLRAMKVRSLVINDFDRVFEKVDSLIAPVMPYTAFGVGEKVNDPLQMYLTDILTVPANLAGLPALALPYGFSTDGLPLGFQLMGPRFSEPSLFNLGKKFEKETNYTPKVASI